MLKFSAANLRASEALKPAPAPTISAVLFAMVVPFFAVLN
jgi:hypothetical protein